MCLECGFYKGRIVIDMKAKKSAREERIQAKKAMLSAQAAQAANPTEEAEEHSAPPSGTEESSPEQK